MNEMYGLLRGTCSGSSGSAGVSGSAGFEGLSIPGLSVFSGLLPAMLQEARRHIKTINIGRKILLIVLFLSESHQRTEAAELLNFVSTAS